MAKRRVIEDSDDEDNAEGTPPSKPAAGSSIVDLESSPEQESVQQSAAPSAGSTELLNREIRAAHKGLIDPTLDCSLPSTRNSSSARRQSRPSPTTSRTRLKRAVTSVEKPKAKKPLKRYGSEANRDICKFHEDSDGDVDPTARKEVGPRLYSTKQPSRGLDPSKIASTLALLSGDTVALEAADSFGKKQGEGSEYAAEKYSMPPPLVKPTSFEQTQRSETGIVAAVSDPTSFKLTPSMPTPADIEPASATSWQPTCSGSRVTTPTMSSRGRNDEKLAPTTIRSDFPNEQSSFDAESLNFEFAEPSSSASILSPSKTITVNRREQLVEASLGDNVIGGENISVLLPSYHSAENINPVALLPEHTQDFRGRDELSLSAHGPESWSVNQTTISKSRKRKETSQGVPAEEMPAEEPGSDDVGIGLPKNQYQPRPSRSRSGRCTEDVVIPTDFSKRPETIGKSKPNAKRRKTTAFQELISKDEVDEEDKIASKPKIEALEIIPPKVSKERDEPNMESAYAEADLIEKTQPDPKSIANSGEKKKRGRPKKAVSEIPEDDAVEETETKLALVDAEPEKPLDLARMKKGKKGAKAKSGTIAISEELVHDSDDELGDVDIMIRQPRKILDEAPGNSMAPEPAEKASPSPTKDSNLSPQNPRKSVSPSKGPDRHSPISSGKVAYRVGLSKRARIAPLLRMVARRD